MASVGATLSLTVVRGTEGEKAVDITALRKATGYITLDKGYENTGSCRSAVTFIDGEKGILRYRGYPIEDLADRSTFTEVAYLLEAAADRHGRGAGSPAKSACQRACP